jgi:hypothetical protein
MKITEMIPFPRSLFVLTKCLIWLFHFRLSNYFFTCQFKIKKNDVKGEVRFVVRTVF